MNILKCLIIKIAKFDFLESFNYNKFLRDNHVNKLQTNITEFKEENSYKNKIDEHPLYYNNQVGQYNLIKYRKPKIKEQSQSRRQEWIRYSLQELNRYVLYSNKILVTMLNEQNQQVQCRLLFLHLNLKLRIKLILLKRTQIQHEEIVVHQSSSNAILQIVFDHQFCETQSEVKQVGFSLQGVFCVLIIFMKNNHHKNNQGFQQLLNCVQKLTNYVSRPLGDYCQK
ncbi:unnamed protein product [Paramecium octaurelia]|uniref:Uncharacterized protein n=1 Tax=Paramecium octaurelia TaxID=43137 RepID=A0A8S1V1Q2_PAROT|nr:unnamed protein product [Paramecium octaurelia]